MEVCCVRGGAAASIVLVLFLVTAVLPAWAAPAPPSDHGLPLMQDADGDGMDDFLDDDDDNDGTPDNEDPAPLDPTVTGIAPTPGSLDADQDTDSDGIPNILDPDDDSDTTPDNEDPAPLDPAPQTPVATEPPSAPPPVDAPPAAEAPVVAEQPLVHALPVTGHGPSVAGDAPLPAAVGLLMLALACGRYARRPIGR